MQISDQNQQHRARQAWARKASTGRSFRFVRTVEVQTGPIVYDEIDGVPSQATEARQVPATVRSDSRESERASGLLVLSGRQRRKARKAARRAAKVTA